MDEECSSSRMFPRYRIGVGTFFLLRGQLESNSFPEFPDSALPEVTVCKVESPLVHVTVVPVETVRVAGTKNFPLLGTEDPGEIVTESPADPPVALPVILPDIVVALPVILPDIVVALPVILPDIVVTLPCALATCS